MPIVKIKKLDHFDNGLELPFYASEGAAGADIRASFENKKGAFIAPGERILVPTGLAFEIEKGYEVQVRPRSGLSLKTNLLVVNSPGTVDCDYRGELKIIIGNLGTEEFYIDHGLRLAQIVVAPVYQADFVIDSKLSETNRGADGFGSTGLM